MTGKPLPAPSSLDGYRYRRRVPVVLFLGDAGQVLARLTPHLNDPGQAPG